MNKSVDVKRNSFLRFIGFYVATVVTIGFATFMPVQSIPYGIGSYGTCQYSTCSITLTSLSTVAADITPSGTVTCTVVKDDVSVRTGASTGYTLQLNDVDSDTSLNRSGGGSITAVSGTRSSPVALTANKWGYRVDGIAGFGAGPTSATSNAAVPGVNFAAVPAVGAPDLIAVKASAAPTAEFTSVWYGLCSDTAIPAGTYTDTVVYTAVTN